MASKFTEIYDGWKHLLFPEERMEKLAQIRFEMCEPCPYNIAGVCRGCGCPVGAKIRSSYSKCPMGKWGEVDVND